MCTTVLNPSCFLLAAVTSTLCPVASSVGEISPEGYPTARWIFMPPCYSRRCQGMPNECQTILHWGSNEFLTECKNECMNKQLSVINKWVIDSGMSCCSLNKLFLLNNVLLLLLLLFHRCCAFTGEHIPMSVGQTMFQPLCICVHIYVYTCTHIIYVHVLLKALFTAHTSHHHMVSYQQHQTHI